MPSVLAVNLMAGACFAQEVGVTTTKSIRLASETEGVCPRFSSRLLFHLNAIVRMRYVENNTVDQVLEWLKQQNCQSSPRNFHTFMVRVMCLMPMKKARDLGVDVDLLRAVRVRSKLTVDPKRRRAAISKGLHPHHARARRRRIVPKPKQRVSTSRNLHSPIHVDSPQKPVTKGVLSPEPKLRGTLENPANSDWQIINQMARRKVFAIDRLVMLNYQGGVVHPKTKRHYSEADLMKDFELTKNEASSCYMTFTDSTR